MFKQFLTYMKDFEPARLNTLRVAVLGIVAPFSANLASWVDIQTAAVTASVVTVLSVIQGELTRLRAWAPATVRKLGAE